MHIISLFLALAILATGLPQYQRIDANHDTQVDLRDAIMHTQSVARSADDPLSFKSSVEDAIMTLNVVAGLKKVIKSDRSQSTPSLSALEMPYMTSAYEFKVPMYPAPSKWEATLPLQSISIKPALPPPRQGELC